MREHRRSGFGIFLAGLACCYMVFMGTSLAFAARTPLIAEGKKTLFQRVISHPGAVTVAAPGGAQGTPVRSFTPFYVYGRTLINGESWLEVSTSSNTAATQWIRGSACSRWDKALSLVMSRRMTRNPLLFFKSLNDLDALVTSEDLPGEYGKLLAAYRAGTLGPSSPLVAVEPLDSAVPQDKFYLMPIFEYSSEYDQHGLRLVKVASINPGTEKANRVGTAAPQFNAGLAFIVDTTISMGPYIEKTKELVRRMYDILEKSPVADDLALGLVAYRNSTNYNPKLQYLAKIISDLAPLKQRKQVEQGFHDFAEATVSTHSFDEDAFAGLLLAADKLSWKKYAFRIACLVTDAGAIKNNDRYSSTGLNEEELRDILQKQGIQLVVIHLQTQAGKRHNLAKVGRQYSILTETGDANLKNFYVPVDVTQSKNADQTFALIANHLAKAILDKLEKARSGKVPSPLPSGYDASPEGRMSQIVDSLGYAAQLEFVGQAENLDAPQMVEAWVADKDLVTLSHGDLTESVNVTVLLNKRQLNSLASQLQHIVDNARASKDDSQEFFNKIISLSANTVVDPENLQAGASALNIAKMGVLPEFLEGLPYVSRIMSLTLQDWVAMGSAEQDRFIGEMEAKIRLYRQYDNDRANWEQFGESDPMEALYRVPLRSLP